MTDTKTFRHIQDRQDWVPVLGDVHPYVRCINKTTKERSYIDCETEEQARAVSCVPEMLNLIHEMIFCIEGEGRAIYHKRVSDILGYVYDL